MTFLSRLWRRCDPASTPQRPAAVTPEGGAVNGFEVLNKVAALPISTWRYEWEPAHVRHLGPMAQDWKAAFDLGDTDTRIPNVDASGVALVSIQALHRLVTELREEIDTLRTQLDALQPPAAGHHSSPTS